MSSKKESKKPSKTEELKKNPPDERFRNGSVHLAIWRHAAANGAIRYTAAFKRSFRAADGTWRDSLSYNVHELLQLKSLVDTALQYIVAQRSDDTGVAVEEKAAA